MKGTIRAILTIITLFSFSCVTYGQVFYTPEQPAINLGRIGIVPASFRSSTSFQKPKTKGEALSSGVAMGVVAPIAGGAAAGGWGIIAGIVLAPVGAVVGGIVGMAKGEGAGKLKDAEDALNDSLATRNLHEEMRERLLSLAREQTQNSFVSLEAKGPSEPGEDVVYDSLSHDDVDTVLEVWILQCDLKGVEDEINPDLRLSVLAATRFISVKDGKVLGRTSFTYEGGARKFSDWSADNAVQFKEELNNALQFHSNKIMEAVSTIQGPPISPSPDP